MKQDTKELVEWLKDHLSHYRNQLAAGQIEIGLVTGELEEKNAYAAINFLNSLPEIESHLCNGGYIQDRNGTPVGHGDTVKVFNSGAIDPYDKATVYWNATNHQFYLIKKKFGTRWSFDSKLIEKVEA